MEEELQPSNTASEASTTTAKPSQSPPPSINLSTNDVPLSDYYFDSSCSTPYASASSSPSRATGGGFFYSAPTSPMHYVLSTSSRSSACLTSVPSDASSTGTSGSFEFEFSARFANPTDSASPEVGAMSSADELFYNGQIRPMKLSSHLERPQVLTPLLDVDESEDNGSTAAGGGSDERCGDEGAKDGDGVFLSRRELRLRDKSLRRRTRSLSPLRTTAPFDWTEFVGNDGEELGHVKKVLSAKVDGAKEDKETPSSSMETTPSASASSSRCSSAGRSSKRWVFLKDFLRSKSEGRSSNGKFWTNISFSPATKDRKSSSISTCISPLDTSDSESKEKDGANRTTTSLADKSKKRGKKSSQAGGKPRNGLGKRRVQAPSPHELHYTANRAQAEEMRKKTFLPYRQGLLGCLGFSSRSYGAINGFARALNPVSSM